MNLLLIINENPAGAHDDVHRAIENCCETKIITNSFIYPFLARILEGMREKQVLNEIINISKNFQPDLILWMHTDKFKITSEAIKELKGLESKPVMGYWDGDLYQSPYRPVPNELLNLCSACDVVFAQGFGEMTEKMKSKGCRDIRFVPAFGDEKRFFPVPNENKEYDVVMIGNNITSRNPFRITMDGTKLRKQIVNEFCKNYKNKFAVFGNNWKGNCARGPINNLEQHRVYSKSKVTISINNSSGKYYFSDRLPIAMLSGIPIIQNFEEGFDKLFKKCNSIIFFKRLEEGIEKASELLLKPQEELNEIGNNLNIYAKKYFTANFIFDYIIKVLISKKTNSLITNPWLS
jgi:spore maturation protein CgeB